MLNNPIIRMRSLFTGEWRPVSYSDALEHAKIRWYDIKRNKAYSEQEKIDFVNERLEGIRFSREELEITKKYHE